MVLSEIDPLSTMVDLHNQTYNPTDLVLNVRRSRVKVKNSTVIAMFLSSVQRLAVDLNKQKISLVLREHSHSMFCTEVLPSSRPSVLDMLQSRFEVKGVLTVRHPMDSFLALRAHGWRHFQPFTLNEYCRRYLLFLDAHASTPIFKYEDFLRHPVKILRQMCKLLNLEFSAKALVNFKDIALSGDSGRKSDTIGPRPRRKVPEPILANASKSECYLTLCKRLHYTK